MKNRIETAEFVYLGQQIHMVYHGMKLSEQLKATRVLARLMKSGIIEPDMIQVHVYPSGMVVEFEDGCAQINVDCTPQTPIRQCSNADGFGRQVVPITAPGVN